MSTGAILLAGGRADRVDGAAKPLFDLGGRSLLQRAVDAAAGAGCAPIAIAGPASPLEPGADVEWVREDPPFGGPVAGIAAALAAWSDPPERVLVLAADLERPADAVALLRAAVCARNLPFPGASGRTFRAQTAHDGGQGWCLEDAEGRPQWLTGVYRTAALAERVAALPSRGRDAPVRALLSGLSIERIPTAHGEAADIDTWEDLDRARRRLDARKEVDG